MGVSVETVVCILRGGTKHSSLGDPYEFSCTAIISGDTAEIKAMSGVVSLGAFKEIKHLLLQMGIKKLVYDRIKNGIKRTVTIS